MNVGERLKSVRKIKGHKLREVAAGAGVDLKIYQAYEAGRARTPINVLLALSDFYGFYSLDDLLGLKNGPINRGSKLQIAYLSTSPENRRIVDFILKITPYERV
jgi:transcriptional regulator with XRE-family HTH domain